MVLNQFLDIEHGGGVGPVDELLRENAHGESNRDESPPAQPSGQVGYYASRSSQVSHHQSVSDIGQR